MVSLLTSQTCAKMFETQSMIAAMMIRDPAVPFNGRFSGPKTEIATYPKPTPTSVMKSTTTFMTISPSPWRIPNLKKLLVTTFMPFAAEVQKFVEFSATST